MTRALLIAMLALTGAALAGPSTALAVQDCPDGESTNWTNTAGGAWENTNNWSNGVPGGGCDATITTPGTYVVTMAVGGAAKGLTVGGASGQQTLQIAGSTALNNTPQQSLFSLGANGLTIGTHGVVAFTSIGANPGDATSTGGGTFVNSGLLETDVGSVAGNRDIQNNVTNNATGVIALHTNTNTCGCGNTHTWINHGTITTDPGTFNTFTGTAAGVLFTQDGGTFTNNGRAIISGGYTHTGGTTTGNPIELCGSSLSGPGPGAAKFEFDTVPSVSCGGGEIDGNVGTGTSVLFHNDQAGALGVTAPTDFTNDGTITFDGTVGAGQDQLIGGHVLTNSGTGSIQLAQPGSSQIQMKVTNHGTVHVTAGSTTVSGVSSNDGTETVDGGTSLVFNNDFTFSGGTIANSGLFRDGGTFTHSGGSSTGTAINLCGATLHAPGPGSASFEMDDLPGTCSGGAIDGDIGSGDSLRIHDDQSGDHVIGTTQDWTNHGTLTLDGAGPGRDVIINGHLITNDGTIQLSQPGISSQFQTSLTNNGTVNVGAGSAFNTTGAVIQAAGNFNVGAGGNFGTNQTVTLTGGTVANSGLWQQTGDLHHSGGNTTGNPLQICSGGLYPTGPGTATFEITEYSGSCNGGGILSDIGADDTVLLNAPATGMTDDLSNATFTNHGTMRFVGGPGQTQLHGGPIVNDGTMSFDGSSDPGTSDNISSLVTNNGAFSVAAGSAAGPNQVIFAGGTAHIGGSLGTVNGVSQSGGTTTVDGMLFTGSLPLSGGTLEGGGTITAPSGVANTGGTVHPTGTLSLTGGYTQGAGGALAIDVGSTTSKLAVGGSASIAGALHVNTPSPQTGTFRILDSAALTGTFGSVDFVGQTDSVSYDGTGVSLSGVAPPGNTAAPSLSGSATVGGTLSVTQGSWSGDPTSFAYQWRDCDASGAGCTDIDGASSSTYVVASSDVGHTLRAVVTATNAGGSTSAVSDASAAVASPGGGDGGGGGGGGGGTPDTTAPVLSGVSASPRTFRVDPSGKAETAVGAATPRGTKLKYGLSEAARVVFTVDAATTGRRSGKRCVKATKKNRKKKHCTRYVRAGRFAVQSSAGAGSHRFSGRIGSKKLKPGSYRVTLVATDAAGNHSAARSTAIKVVAR